MKYMVEDTRNGYRLTVLDGKSGKPRHHFDEEGGHGPVEHLFAEADRLWDVLRALTLRDSRERVMQLESYIVAVVGWLGSTTANIPDPEDYPALDDGDLRLGRSLARRRYSPNDPPAA